MIFFDTAGQARVFLLLLYAGFAAGLLYDLLGPLRRRRGRAGQAALDAVWCLFTAGACALALAAGGEHLARLYALLGLACGGAVYSLGLRRLALAAVRRFRRKKAPENEAKPPASA